MESKQLDVVCPCCSSRLAVDVRTGAILRTLRPGERDETGKPVVKESDWDAALGKVRGRATGGGSKLDAALEREKDKAARLDDMFRQASRKLGDEPAE